MFSDTSQASKLAGPKQKKEPRKGAKKASSAGLNPEGVGKSSLTSSSQDEVWKREIHEQLSMLNDRIMALENTFQKNPVDQKQGNFQATQNKETEELCDVGSRTESEDRLVGSRTESEDHVVHHKTGLLHVYVAERSQEYEFQPSIWDAALFWGLETLKGDMVVLCLTFLLNAVVQFLFTLITYKNMTDAAISEDSLLGLFSWRLLQGHHFDNLDLWTNTSLVQRVCAGDSGLGIATFQSDLYSSLDGFLPDTSNPHTSMAGPTLLLLAELSWMAAGLVELQKIIMFTSAMWSLYRASENQTLRTTFDEEFAVTSIPFPRFVFSLILIVLPRLFLDAFLIFTGIYFLHSSVALAEMVLNCIALVFILDLDEVLYQIFVPKRTRSLVEGAKPIMLRSFFAKHHMDPGPIVFFAMVVIATTFVSLIILRPMTENVEAAMNILCGGNTAWVYDDDLVMQTVVFGETVSDYTGKEWARVSRVPMIVTAMGLDTPSVFTKIGITDSEYSYYQSVNADGGISEKWSNTFCMHSANNGNSDCLVTT